MKIVKHYGEDVIIQYCNDFRKALREQGIKFIDLPIKSHEIITYEKDGRRSYVVINKIEDGEKTYMTRQIPLDMDWEKLITDCDEQTINGKEPMEMETKAHMLIDEAAALARKFNCETGEFTFNLSEPTAKEIVVMLIRGGYSVADILQMDHHDIDEEFLNELIEADK